MRLTDPEREWFEPLMQVMVNKTLTETDVSKIDVQGLKATTEISQEFLDFLFRQTIENGVLESLIIRNLQGLDQPFDSQLLMKMVNKTQFFALTAINFGDKKEIRDSFNDCIASFLESDQKNLERLNISSYITTPEEAVRFI